MTTAVEKQYPQLQANLPCPVCGYSLRGLQGEVVNCPECGQRCDVQVLSALRYTETRYHAPGSFIISLPGIWSVAFAPFITWHGIVRHNLVMVLVLAAIWLIGWMLLMCMAWGVFESRQGVRLALLAHIVWLKYIIPVAFVCVVFVRAEDVGISMKLSVEIVAKAVLAPLLVLLFWLCYRIDRLIARQCVRRYLTRVAASDRMQRR